MLKKEAAQAGLSLNLSKCHIVGNYMRGSNVKRSLMLMIFIMEDILRDV